MAHASNLPLQPSSASDCVFDVNCGIVILRLYQCYVASLVANSLPSRVSGLLLQSMTACVSQGRSARHELIDSWSIPRLYLRFDGHWTVDRLTKTAMCCRVSRRQLHSVYTLQATSLGQVAEYRTLQPTATDWCDTADYVLLLHTLHLTSATSTLLARLFTLPSHLHRIYTIYQINQSIIFYVVWATNSCCIRTTE